LQIELIDDFFATDCTVCRRIASTIARRSAKVVVALTE
jgi:thiol-disulfide isomerase/thioredoxin